MIIRRYTSYAALLCVMCSYAQTEMSDTITSKELNEIVVEAQNQRASATSTTYIPASRQKNVATDAISLLSQMAIPQLSVDLMSQSVKTISGQSVAIYIDYVAATAQDLSGMRTTDVKKVEYLLNPTDPRFRGAQYVVNFIMQKYEWGGYTKLNADQWLGVKRSEADVYSKFVYKRMTFDLFANEIYLTDRHSGTESTEIFHFTDLYGQGPQTVERTSLPASRRYRNNSNDVTFRALYNTDKLQVTNQLSFANSSVPRNEAESSLIYSDDFMPSSTARTIASNRSWSLNYNHETYVSLSEKVGLDVEANYSYNHNTTNSDYTDNDFSIVNNAKENSNIVRVTPCLVWNINQYNSFTPFIHGEYTGSTIDYYGNSPSRQKYDVWAFVGSLKYMFQKNQWSAGGSVSGVYANTNLSGTKIEDTYPQCNVFGMYSPNNKNQIEIDYACGKQLPDTYQKSPNILQQDELMWYTGTPELKNYWMHQVHGVYTWLPNNKWQLAFNGNYYVANNRVVPVYTPDGPEGTMLRRYVNNGDYRYGYVTVNGTAKFLNGKLVARLTPGYYLHKTTGEYAQSLNQLNCSAQITWYFGNFYLFGWFSAPTKYLSSTTGYRETVPTRYLLQLGWGRGSWRASVRAYNFLRSSWESSSQVMAGKYYQSDVRTFGMGEHMRLQLTASYTFGYGKKVQQGNEVGGSGTGTSAILK